MPDNGYFRAKVAQEKLIETSGIPYTIIVELSPAYVDVAVQRWQAFTGERALHASTGEAFPKPNSGEVQSRPSATN